MRGKRGAVGAPFVLSIWLHAAYRVNEFASTHTILKCTWKGR